jgi:protein-tyrosine phosphatase
MSLSGSGLAHFVASDGHDVTRRPPVLRPAFDHVAAEFGQAVAQLLFVDNPAAALTGGPIQQTRPVRRKRFGIF